MSAGSGLGPLTGPGGGAGVREQLGRAAWGGQARGARDPPVQGRAGQDGAAAAGHRQGGTGGRGGEEGPRGGRRASPRAGQRLPAARVARPPRASGVLAASSTSGRGGRAGSPIHSKEGAARAGSRGPPDP